MNINCPHCTAYLTVPEQYSGQLMKCPKCNSNFTVPALPAIDQEPAFAMAQNPPAPAPTPPAPTPPAAPSMPPAFQLAPEVPAFQLAPPAPAFSHSPTPTPAPTPIPAATPTPRSASIPRVTTPAAPPGTTTHALHVPLSKAVLQWIPVGSAVLLFIIQFFPWVGVFPGGVPAATQSAWGAAFGDYSAIADMKEMVTVVAESDPKGVVEAPSSMPKLSVAEPKTSPLMIFYLLPFFLVTVVVSIAIAALPFVQIQLPPAVANLLPWKWGILAILNAVLLLFLVLQLLLSFGLETSVKEAARIKADAVVRKKTIIDPKEKAPELNTVEEQKFDAIKGIYANWFARTIWLKLALVLHILATLAAATMYWMEKRGTNHVQFETGVRW
jgi:hypothetical protein